MRLVSIEAELKAEHCFEPESDMQFCAEAAGTAASSDNNTVLVFHPVYRDFCFLLVSDLLLPAMVGSSDSAESIISKGIALSAGDSRELLSQMCPEVSSLIVRPYLSSMHLGMRSEVCLSRPLH